MFLFRFKNFFSLRTRKRNPIPLTFLNMYFSYTIYIHQNVMLKIVELVLLKMSLVMTILIFFLVTSYPLHIHLIRLIKICGIYYMLSVFCRIVIILGILSGWESLDIDYLLIDYGPPILLHSDIFGFLQFSRGVFVGATVFTYIFMLFERILASFMYRTYERWKSVYVFIVPSIMAFGISFVVCFCMVSGMSFTIYERVRGSGIPVIILAIPSCSIAIFALTTIICAHFYNKRKYNQAQKLHSYNLSHKFQLVENIRSIELICRAGIFMCLYICYGGLAFSLSFILENPNLKFWCFMVFNYVLATFILAIVLALLVTQTWRDIFYDKLSALKQLCIKNIQVEDVNLAMEKIKSLHGQRLIISSNHEKDLYFQQLQTSWE